MKAVARFVRCSPQKAREISKLIKGKGVNEALSILRFSPKRTSSIVEKVVKSAMANASHLSKVDVDNLLVDRVWVNQGPTLKRWIPRAMGRPTRILKRMSHITVVLKESPPAKAGVRRAGK